MFNRQQFTGIPVPNKQNSSNPLYSRINSGEESKSQDDEAQLSPQAAPAEEQIWAQVEIPPQLQPKLQKEENQPAPVEEKIPDEAEFEDDSSDEGKKYFEHLPKPLPEETLLVWKSDSRPFKKRNRQFYTTIATIVILISLILFFAGQFLPIAVVISIAFLSYVLSSVPPTESEKKITTYGIRVENELYYWEEMGRFWFDEKYASQLVNIEIIRFPGRLTLLMGDLKNEELEDILKEVLIMQKPEDTFFDKSSKWLQEKIPLDNA